MNEHALPGMVMIGRLTGIYGVQGWIKLYSYTEPRHAILEYACWWLGQPDGRWRPHKVVAGRINGKKLIVQLEGVNDREAARALIDVRIAVPRTQLPTLGPNEFYWAELEGLKVVTLAGIELGVVDHLLETGANDVLVVQGAQEKLIPYVWGQVVREVDLAHRVIRVDWDPEY